MSDRLHSAYRWKLITPGNAVIEPVPDALWANSAGDITIVGDNGVSAVFTVLASQPIPLQPHKLTATTVTGNIYALYNTPV